MQQVESLSKLDEIVKQFKSISLLNYNLRILINQILRELEEKKYDDVFVEKINKKLQEIYEGIKK